MNDIKVKRIPKFLIILLVVFCLTATALESTVCALPVINVDQKQASDPNEEVYKKIIYVFLEPSIDEVLADYYPKPVKYDPRDLSIESIERPNGRGTFYFVIKIQVSQYIGPHNNIGRDYITLETNLHKMRALEYKHTDDFDFSNQVQRNPIRDDTEIYSNVQFSDNVTKDTIHDLVMYLLGSYIDQAVLEYYGQPYDHDPWSDEVLELTSLKKRDGPFCRIRLKVIPYTGPHNSVGIDKILLNIARGPQVNVEKFEHLASHDWQGMMQNFIRSINNKGVWSYLIKAFSMD